MSLANLLFTEYRRRVLGLLLLNPEKHYYLREIAKETGTAPGTLTRELTKLAEAGLLEKTKIGNQLHFSANKACPIFEELASILRKTTGLVEVLADALEPLAEHIAVAFVFGSMASGKAGAGSDIDVMVISDVSFSDVVAALYPAQTTLARDINPKVYRFDEWRRLMDNQEAFVQDILTKPKLFILGCEANLKE